MRTLIFSFPVVITCNLKSVTLGLGKTFTLILSMAAAGDCKFFAKGDGGGGPPAQTGNLTALIRMVLLPQLFKDCAVTLPLTDVGG